MDLLADYSDASGEAGAGDEDDGASAPRPAVNIAPEVHALGKALVTDGDGQRVVSLADTQNLHDPAKKTIYYNARYEDMHAPLEGPAHPHRAEARGQRNHATGHVETAFVSRHAFEEQFNTFHARGYGAEPSGRGLVGDADAIAANAGDSVFDANAAKRRKVRGEILSAQAASDASVADYGAWAPARDGSNKPLSLGDLSAEQMEYVKWHAARREANLRARGKLKDEDGNVLPPIGGGSAEAGASGGDDADFDAGGGEGRTEKSVFHGDSERNYAGESWIKPPKDRKRENDHCYVPKRCIHTWSGHAKGTQAIRFFPRHGHLLLSAGLDSKVKIWDVHGHGKCMRTYMGHEKALKDIQFTNDGTRFVSTSWDKKIKLWDTETGKVITSVGSGKIAYCATLHPDDDKQNVCMAGQSDKKILQYDFNTGDVVQEYDQHLGAVNSVTFCDEGRRFVSSSDDKSLRVWEFGIPVTMKYIADPAMHSMPAVALSPNANWLACQSLDNQIVVYSTKDKFRMNKKKRFAGHHNSGYACQVTFSPDGRFVASGSGDGKVFFWDWKSGRIFKSLKAHEKVVIGVQWHPLEQSKVATCSWDGAIKYWD